MCIRDSDNTFTVTPETGMPLDELVSRLIRSGYVRRPQVDGFCQFSVRGGIVDVFPPNETNPIRVEYWGDEIDTMSYFELDSQRRTEKALKIKISPAREVTFGEGELFTKLTDFCGKLGSRKATAEAKKTLQQDLDTLSSGMELNSLDKYFPLAYENFATIVDYFENAPVFVSEFVEAKETARSAFWQYSDCLLYTSRCV